MSYPVPPSFYHKRKARLFRVDAPVLKKSQHKGLKKVHFSILGGDYMISVSRDEVLSRFAGIPAVL